MNTFHNSIHIIFNFNFNFFPMQLCLEISLISGEIVLLGWGEEASRMKAQWRFALMGYGAQVSTSK